MKYAFQLIRFLRAWVTESLKRMRLSTIRDNHRIKEVEALKRRIRETDNPVLTLFLSTCANLILYEPTPEHIVINPPWKAYKVLT